MYRAGDFFWRADMWRRRVCKPKLRASFGHGHSATGARVWTCPTRRTYILESLHAGAPNSNSDQCWWTRVRVIWSVISVHGHQSCMEDLHDIE
ncbi:unnamed protein product [Mycena citricolor]|uniref:Uncharacterized protein n=1 Tax=Mycena citricolor TaxID=2018698 RepID=A0AAD2H7E2_9AGAR|nr:unnamed protein product [Mycena citricolor]